MSTRSSTSPKPKPAVEAVPDVAPDDREETAAERAERERQELNAATVPLEWRGEVFEIPKRQGRWPVRAARAFEEGEYVKALVAFIGEEGWNRLERVCPVVDDLNEFSEYAGKVIQRECVP